jgi:NADP-dependent 3-hydroxy acid dehydrogenase YdfG
MIISITGHTSGIGKCLFDYLSLAHDVSGFSRSNGYNITSELDRVRIYEVSKNSDVFINNAYNNFDDCQLYMLKHMIENNTRTDQIVINISSRYTGDKNKYCETKQKIDEYCRSRIYCLPRIINIKPGLTDTPRVSHDKNRKMNVCTIITVIDFVLKNILI